MVFIGLIAVAIWSYSFGGLYVTRRNSDQRPRGVADVAVCCLDLADSALAQVL